MNWNKLRLHFPTFMTETIKLIGSTKSKVTKDGNGENVPRLEITELILVHWNIVEILLKI